MAVRDNEGVWWGAWRLLAAGLMLGASHLAAAVPTTTSKERAEVAKQSVARQGVTGRDTERKSLAAAREPFAKQSVAGQSKAHRKLSSQPVAGQRPERKEIAKHSAAEERTKHPMRARNSTG